ncbi:MAG TPA: YeeE/YedE family protein [Acidiphilium sp.]|jgi:uncharacterized membrane protein YedE/YeeE|uniref:YeeE/YedE family protein n=1 Tax=unclassified Acidiphilium TaxID=2617493 RepID=UPI000BD8F7F6|nr:MULTISPECIES: YeeE/YedE family protein [unclassified Acidiphilium]OYV57543.1 MAG: hypothetical protein B7Z76_01890 [Acidiphilium sp. 20-67-58]OYV81156.1 MAG: hypothetical protein B7Z64_11170 [Acidiphilium sp. 21-68-69]HQT59578.1 YeeE/YedE family protein [Acidiphilium sp.]HQU10335.1 YeeE/YedE family protein [Acidiphilium sp.]
MLLPVLFRTRFTPLPDLAGGLMIGASAALLWVGIGRIAGITGIAGDLIQRSGREWRLAFISGLVLAGLLARAAGAAPAIHVAAGLPVMIGAGLLVGIGTALGGGCTSGHGVCGLARVSPRSIVATLVFLGIAGLVVFLTRHLGAA